LSNGKVITDAFGINKKDVISIVGAGGKTSLMFHLANNLRGRKIVTTTTKIMKPENYNVEFGQINFKTDNEIIVTAKTQEGPKLIGYNQMVDKTQYDYLLIEADGSRMLPLKGWGQFEPVIYDLTTKTIGIIDITTIGLEISRAKIFRLNELSKITLLEENININNLVDIVNSRNGLFKESIGQRILYINKVESEVDGLNAKELIKKLNESKQFYKIDRVVIGIIFNNYFEVIK